ncbi:MAG TPA: maleylpyruvate isomerase N-terminal domain-containing protein [Acidimicrobiales bacterium]|nr:maleylpyruvate isomerase N-terminal domain-containing protein [Acidimicrobiales bacterium]
MPAPTTVDWAAARRAVADAGPRVTALLRKATKAEAPALGEWNLTQVATHLSHSVDAVAATAAGGGNMMADVSSLPVMSQMLLDGEGRRPLPELADRIDASVERFLADMEKAAAVGDTSHSWFFEGTAMPLSVLTSQVLSELTLHGRDIAVAEGVPWPIDNNHAALILQGFVFPSLHTLGTAMVVQEKAGDARFEVKLRGDGKAWLTFAGGNLTVAGARPGPVDCHLSVDPEAFLLVAWGRIDQWSAMPKGKLLAWGKKPWLGLQLRSWLRNP